MTRGFWWDNERTNGTHGFWDESHMEWETLFCKGLYRLMYERSINNVDHILDM